MEGYLSLWTGVLSQWRRFYFILHNDILTFCSEKAGEKEGSIHLKIASIVSVIDDPLKINIHTGTHILFIRADTIHQRIDWMKAISAAQQDILANDLSLQMKRLENDGARGYEIVDKRVKTLDSLVAELWNSQAELEDLVTQLIPRLQKNNASVRICEKMIETTNNIKHKASDSLGIIEQIKVSNRQKPTTGRQDISYQSEKRRHNDQEVVQNLLPVLMKNNSVSMEEYRSFDRGYDGVGGNRNVSMDQYNSFEKPPGGVSLERINEISNESQYMSFDRTGPPVSMKLLRKISEENSCNSFRQEERGTPNIPRPSKKVPSSRGQTKCTNTYKNSFINRNLVFIQYPIGAETYRLSLPVSISPDQKMNIMSILKDSIGADLTRISLPVSLNQPLSVLQKGAEQMYYSPLLDDANQFSDPSDRLLHVVAFVISQYSLTINKTKKPFNPLLGETYQYIDQKRKFRYLAQQVSHHPPISAMQCTSDNYQYFMNSKGSTSFRGASIKMNPESSSRILLKRHNDTIVFNKCTTSLNNLIVGSLYVDNYGDVDFKMYNEGEVVGEAHIVFSESSIWGNSQYKVSGTLKDRKGKEIRVDGRWNESLSYTNPKIGVTKQIWSLTHKSLPQNYYFNDLATNLNNINPSLLDTIAPSDSRLRPDQRALEHGNKELAATEKQRLEQQQREKRKIMESKGDHHSPLWFDEVLIKESGEKEWVSNLKYWNERKQQNWGSVSQIY